MHSRVKKKIVSKFQMEKLESLLICFQLFHVVILGSVCFLALLYVSFFSSQNSPN